MLPILVLICCLTVDAGGLDYSKCAIDANSTYLRAPNDTFLYDKNGSTTSNASEAWGISYKSCRTLCRAPENGKFYNWNHLSQGITSWVIPWFALTAQLPFATKDKKNNLMALLLALGSPALIGYSLALTVLNSESISCMFRQIKGNSQLLLRPEITRMLQAPRLILIETQHIPIQIFNGSQREFAQLVVSPENRVWWESLHDAIKSTKREWTLSLYAQIGWVSIAQALTVVQYFNPESANTNVGIGLAINSLWLWMIPVILGWVRVGTQTSACSIKKAISKTSVPFICSTTFASGECFGIRDRTQYNDNFSSKTRSGRSGARDLERQVRPDPEHIERSPSSDSFLGCSIPGCELQPGPIFNYARIWTHMNAAKHVVEGLKKLSEQQFARKTVSGRPWVEDPTQWNQNFRGSPEQMSRYVSALNTDEPNLSVHARGSSDLYENIAHAAIVAMVLQWGSTGAAMIIAYNTPVRGLGCQSGSYLVYGTAATLAWSLLVFSAFLSHRHSLFRENITVVTRPRVPRFSYALGASAVVTRLVGQALAVVNATFLVVTSVAEFTGLYDFCWCDASIPSLGETNGWVILWASDTQIGAASSSAWGGGTLMSVLCMGIMVVFYFIVERG